MPSQGNMYILGDIFLRGWYSVYDFDSNLVGIARNKYSLSKVVVYKPFPTWAIVLIVLVVIVVVVGLIYVFMRWRRAKKLRAYSIYERIKREK